MAAVNVTGFQRMRRLAAEKAAKKATEAAEIEQKEVDDTKTPTNPENAGEARNEGENDDQKIITPDDVDAMDVEKVKAELEKREIKFAHNTGEAKLREKLTDAVNG